MSFIQLGAALSTMTAEADKATSAMTALAGQASEASKAMGSVSTAAVEAKKATDEAKKSMGEGSKSAEDLFKAFDEIVKRNGPITAYLGGIISQFRDGVISGREFTDLLFNLLPQIQYLISLLATEGIVLGDAQKVAGELAGLAEQIDKMMGR